MKTVFRKIILLVGATLTGSYASAGVIYTNSFDSAGSIGAEWTSPTYWHGGDHGLPGIIDGHIGDYSTDNSTTLTLTGLGTHTQVALEFDLYLFNTWDGEDTTYGPDYFSLSGDVTFSETFTNHQTEGQSYAGVADVNPGLPGVSVTQVYYGLDATGTGDQFLVNHTGSTFTVTFQGPTTQADEQWGIDNIKVTLIEVPEPATLAILGLGLMGLGVSRRRRAA